MPALAAMLIPLIPGLLQSILQIVDTIREHPDTPEAGKAQLSAISEQIDTVAAKVAEIQL